MSNSGDELDPLYRAIGFFVIQWGSAEQSLDAAVSLIYHAYGGRTLARRLPKQLEKKIEFVRSCVNQLPALAGFKEQGNALASAFERMSTARHDLIHGAVSSVTPQGTKYAFAKLDFDDPHTPTLRQFHFDGADFPALADDLIRLGADAVKFAMALIDASELKPKTGATRA